MSRRRGSALVETAMWVPVLSMLFFAMLELARVSYTYYTLHKMLYAIARLAGTQQGANFCDATSDANTNLKNFILHGGVADVATDPILPNLTADQIAIRIERYHSDTDSIEECDCSDTGCDPTAGGGVPDFIVVSLPDGYPIKLTFPGVILDPIPLRPQIRIPYGGT